MNDYYYSQRDLRWAKKRLGKSGLTMEAFGCVVTACAIMLSYYFKREVLPSELLKYLNDNNGFTKDGLLIWRKIVEFSSDALRYSLMPNPKEGELTYGLRNVRLGRYNHWVADHPENKGWVIDPLLGDARPYDNYEYLNRNRYFLGKEVEDKLYPVDVRYQMERTWIKFMQEKSIAFALSPRGLYIRKRIKRLPTNREISGIVYGAHEFDTVFRNKYGDQWLYTRKPNLK